MPSIDELRRRLRAASPLTAQQVRLPDETFRWKYTWRTSSIADQEFPTDVTSNMYETSILRSSFPGATLLEGENNTISDCLFEQTLTAKGDNWNFLNTRFNGPVRYQANRIAFTGCHFTHGGPEPCEGAPEATSFISNGCIIDSPPGNDPEADL